MSIFRIYVDGQLFYHPQLSQLAITEAKMTEDAENIDSLTLSAPLIILIWIPSTRWHPPLFAKRMTTPYLKAVL